MNPDDIASVLLEQEEKVKAMELSKAADDLSDDEKNKIFVSKVLIEYDNVESAHQAAITLGGLKYDNRTVICGFFDEERYRTGRW
jgi:hypothetical protein